MDHVLNIWGAKLVQFLPTIGVLALLLGVLVLFHEFGHYAVARFVGMKVHEFAFGFGPILARLFKRGGTEFNIRAVPLGGFVRIAGMEPGEEDADAEGGFNRAPIWQRALVILAGPFMSLVLGYLVFFAMGLHWGFPTNSRVEQVVGDGPAARAGLQKGDVITAINGDRVTSMDRMLQTIWSSAGREVTLDVNRGSRRLQVKATPRLGYNEQLGRKVGQLGFAPRMLMVRCGLIESVQRGTQQTYETAAGIVSTLFSKRIAKEAGGIVMIGYITGEMVKAGAYAVFLELALLSVMLGIINLIPWPVLDGGHILYLLVEKIRGKKLEPERWYAIQTVGFAVLMVLVVFLVFFDISRLHSGTFPK